MLQRALFLGIIGTVLAQPLGGVARAGFLVNVTQSGGDVIATGSGTINTTDLTQGIGSAEAELNGAVGLALFGPNHALITNYYSGISDPIAFGTIDTTFGADSGTGDLVGVGDSSLWLPLDYVSGSLLTSSDTWSGQSFSSLGLTPGTYTWTWGTGADADFFTMNISNSAVPEPSSLLLLGSGLGVIVLVPRARRRAAMGA